MRLGRCTIMAILSLSLLSCATTRYSQEHRDTQQLETGRSFFESGNYHDAFRFLLPLAVQGNPQAEYAVGYMYYYGYGVSAADTESGLFWIDKSAAQNYPPAIAAMNLIHQHDIDDAKAAEARKNATDIRESVQPLRAPIVVTPRRIKKISMNEQDNVLPQKSTAESLESPHPNDVVLKEVLHENHTQENIQAKPQLVQSATENQQTISPKYTLQLYGSYKLTHVKYLQAQLRLKNTGHIYQTSHEGKDWYVLTFGNFVTAHEATATKNNLPKELSELSPWVRNVHTLNRLA